MAGYGFFGGLAEGVETGAKLGFIARQTRVAEKEQATQAELAKAHIAKEKQQADLLKLEKATTIFKDAPKSLKQQIYKQAIVPLANEALGANLDPNVYTDSTEATVVDFGKWLGMHLEGKTSWEDFLNGTGVLRTNMDKENSAQTGSILSDLPEAKAAKASDITTPEEALKRRMEIITKLADLDKRTELEAALASTNPDLAKAFGKTKPTDKAAVLGAALAELRQLNKHLPPESRLKEVTAAQFEQLRAVASAKLGRKVSDAELYAKFLPTEEPSPAGSPANIPPAGAP